MMPSIELPQLNRQGRSQIPARPPSGFDVSKFDQISVAAPCSMRWDDMDGDARSRFCGSCSLNVYDISEMTREEAAALIAEKEGHVCVRFFRRADGTILTKNCPVGLRRVRHAIVRVVGSIAAVAVLGVGAVAAMGERLRGRSVRISETEPYVTLTRLLRTPPTVVPPTPPWQGQMLMGSVCLPTPPRGAPPAGWVSPPPNPFGPASRSDPRMAFDGQTPVGAGLIDAKQGLSAARPPVRSVGLGFMPPAAPARTGLAESEHEAKGLHP